MPLFSSSERRFAEAIACLAYCNPFTPHRIRFEREALGRAFVDAPLVWSLRPDVEGERPNIGRLMERAEPMAAAVRERLVANGGGNATELGLYEDLALYVLYQRYRIDFQGTIRAGFEGRSTTGKVAYWRRFCTDFEHALRLPGVAVATGLDPAHMFACFYQIRRAFHHIFTGIVGGSMPAAQLRAAVWQSIFTHDMRRYPRVLYRHMGDMTTLIMGPSGTGKELVARAVGQSRYIPLDPATERFAEEFAAAFFALNLSALSPTLIESELFGHKRGSFTGAVGDRAGWLEVCPPLGTVFLDEIGELDPTIQVKLLRLLQTRTFQRLGETKDRRFLGKIIAATNRDLARDIQAGRFREDFYYRMCSDIITTPTLHALLADSPDDLHDLVLFIAGPIVGEEAESVTGEVVRWVDEHLGRDYPWPGNIRELEQCVRNVVIRQSYEPPRLEPRDADEAFLRDVRDGRLDADALLRAYCTRMYDRCGTYEQAARRLGLDRRTVKAKVDPTG